MFLITRGPFQAPQQSWPGYLAASHSCQFRGVSAMHRGGAEGPNDHQDGASGPEDHRKNPIPGTTQDHGRPDDAAQDKNPEPQIHTRLHALRLAASA